MDLTNAQWRKSSYSGTNGGNCVEVALNLPGTVAVRDSKNPNRGDLVLTLSQWEMFVSRIRDGYLR